MGRGRARTDRGGVDSRTTAWALEAGLNEASMSPSRPTSASRLDCLACPALLCAKACLAITDASFGSWSSLSLSSPLKPGSEDASDDEGEGLGERARCLFPGIVPDVGPGAGESVSGPPLGVRTGKPPKRAAR